ncbi:MAG TPA: hypothetical protein VEJ87_05260 [Acidimicrobiales bacterium]|nr:hypothetical protein [Acidimicrobiales bacterium]
MPRTPRTLRIVGRTAALAVPLLLASCTSGATGGGSPAHRVGAAPARRSERQQSTPSDGTGGSSLSEEPTTIVTVTTGGVLEVLDSSTGLPIRTLATDATGDEVSLSPDGSTVYFEVRTGCEHEIEAVPISGGTPRAVAAGMDPAVSPDGSELAYARQPDSTMPGCLPAGAGTDASQLALVVRNIATGQETTYPMSPQSLSAGLPEEIGHLSWGPDSRTLAVSIPAAQDNEGWQVVLLDTRTASYYVGTGTNPLPVPNAASNSYYREGVFEPDGNLFVNLVCCAGEPATISSSLLLTVSPSTGRVVRQIAVGFTDVDHTSLDVDRSGQWILYLSGHNLLVSAYGNRPGTLASGFVAAAW